MKNLALNTRMSSPDLTYYCLNCTKFGKLLFRKIITIAATRCHILKLKCTKFNFGAVVAHSALPDPLAVMSYF